METIWAKHMMTNVPCQASGELRFNWKGIGIRRSHPWRYPRFARWVALSHVLSLRGKPETGRYCIMSAYADRQGEAVVLLIDVARAPA